MDRSEVLKQLVQVGAERMAKVLLNLAERSDEASEVIGRLLATPEENVKRLKRRLAGLKRGRKFVDWREASNFAPKFGGGSRRSVFERCDDSSGMIGDVFRSETQLPGEIHDMIGAGHQPIGFIQLHSDI